MSNSDFVARGSCISTFVKILEYFSLLVSSFSATRSSHSLSSLTFPSLTALLLCPALQFNWHMFLHNPTTLVMSSTFLCSLSTAVDSVIPNIITLFLVEVIPCLHSPYISVFSTVCSTFLISVVSTMFAHFLIACFPSSSFFIFCSLPLTLFCKFSHAVISVFFHYVCFHGLQSLVNLFFILSPSVFNAFALYYSYCCW